MSRASLPPSELPPANADTDVHTARAAGWLRAPNPFARHVCPRNGLY
jgi:hypothetical protein